MKQLYVRPYSMKSSTTFKLIEEQTRTTDPRRVIKPNQIIAFVKEGDKLKHETF
jgi:hypothetical protein